VAKKIEHQNGDLKVWHTPQIPGKPFEVDVENLVEARLILDALADYDDFQFKNKIRPDYSNANGLVSCVNGEWEDFDPDSMDGFVQAVLYLFPDVDTISCEFWRTNMTVEQLRQVCQQMEEDNEGLLFFRYKYVSVYSTIWKNDCTSDFWFSTTDGQDSDDSGTFDVRDIPPIPEAKQAKYESMHPDDRTKQTLAWAINNGWLTDTGLKLPKKKKRK